jgi:hypothetical protein
VADSIDTIKLFLAKPLGKTTSKIKHYSHVKNYYQGLEYKRAGLKVSDEIPSISH